MHDATKLEPFDQTKAITITEACGLIRSRTGKRLNRQVCQRYAGRGIHVAGNQRLYLPAVRISGVYWTMPSWVQWFQSMRTSKPRTITDDVRPRTELQASRGHQRAMKQLKKMGVKV